MCLCLYRIHRQWHPLVSSLPSDKTPQRKKTQLSSQFPKTLTNAIQPIYFQSLSNSHHKNKNHALKIIFNNKDTSSQMKMIPKDNLLVTLLKSLICHTDYILQNGMHIKKNGQTLMFTKFCGCNSSLVTPVFLA